MSHRADPESPHPVAVHRSKRDTWLAVICRVSAVALIASAAAVGVAPMSGPAMSLDRLRVERAGVRVPLLISPRDTELFLTDLAARDPGLRRSADALVRPEA